MSNFYTPPLPSFSVCPNESELPRPPAPGHQNLSYQPPPYPHSLWYSCSISIVFSRSFHQIPCNSQLFTKNSSKHVSLGMLKIKPKCCLKQNQKPVWNTYSRTRHQSGTLIAEPDTCLEHWILITVILIIALDIQFLRIPSLSPPL